MKTAHRGWLVPVLLFLLQSCSVIEPQNQRPTAEQTQDSVSVRKFKLESTARIRFEKRFFQAQQAKLAGNRRLAVQKFRKIVKDYPRVAAAQFELGRLLVADEAGDEGIYFLKNAYELDERNYWYTKELASAYQEQREFKKAARFYEKLIDQKPKDPKLYSELANMYILSQQMDKAIDVYDRLEAIIGVNEGVSFQKQKLYLRLDQPKKAAGEIKKLIEANPQKLSYYQRLAEIYLNNGMVKDAEATFERLLQKDPDNAEVHLGLAQLYDQQGKEEAAREQLRQAFDSAQLDIDTKVRFLYRNFLQEDGVSTQEMNFGTDLARKVVRYHPDEAKAHALLGDFLYNNDHPEEAKTVYERSVELDPNVYAVWQQLLFIYASQSEYTSLLETSDEVISLFPNQPIGFYFNGVAKNQLGAYRAAIESLETGVSITLDNPSLKSQMYSTMAEAYHQLDRHESSDEYFEKALEIEPNDPTTLNNYAYYLSVRGEKLDRAEEMSQRSLDFGGENPSFLDTYGWIQYKKGNYQKAASYIEKAIERAGDQVELLEHYGDVMNKMGNRQKAVEYWRSAIEAGGNASELKSKIEQSRP